MLLGKWSPNCFVSYKHAAFCVTIHELMDWSCGLPEMETRVCDFGLESHLSRINKDLGLDLDS